MRSTMERLSRTARRSRPARGWTGIAAATVVATALMLTVEPADAQTPSAPSVTANASATRGATIEVTFTAVEGALGYLVVPQRLRSDGQWTALDGREERLSARRPVVFDGLANGATYRACVAAILPDGPRTGLSTSAVPYGLPGAPAISSVERSGTELEVTWSPATANGRQITAYEVSVAPDDGIAPIVVGGNETSTTISGLRENAEYVVSVRATNLRGQGEAGQSSAAAISTSGPSFDGSVLVVSVAMQGAAGTTMPGSASDVQLVAGVGTCGGATTTVDGGDGVEGPGDDSADAGGGAVTSEGQTDGAAVGSGPAVTRRPPPPAAEDEPTDEAAGPAPAPEPVVPQVPGAPEAAPEAAAPAPIPTTDASSRRSPTLILVGLLGVAALVIGGVLAQQRLSRRPVT